MSDDKKGFVPEPMSAGEPKVVKTDDNKKEKKPWSKKKKIIVGVVVALVLIAALGSNGNSSNGSSSGTSSTEETSTATKTESSTASAKPEKVKIDKSSLKTCINQYSGTTGDNYTPETYQTFANALAKAQEVDADENATQNEVDSARSSLLSAYGALKEAFKPENYATPAFVDVARNPDNYKGQKIVFTGKVLQVLEGSEETDLRIATDGGYDDVVFVGFDPSILGGTHVLEDDSVTVYGTCIGQYSYNSTLGSKISLPGLYADQVVINQ